MTSSGNKRMIASAFAVLATGLGCLAWTFFQSRPAPGTGIESGRSTSPQQRLNPTRSRTAVESPPERINHCISTGDAVEMQIIVSRWFEDDPVAVRDWLETQQSLKPLQPALIQIAKDVSAAGHPADALKWAELMESGPDRDQTLLEIYASGRRYGSLPEEVIRSAPFPREKIDALLSGAVDD